MSNFLEDYHEFLKRMKAETEAIKQHNKELKEEMERIDREYKQRNRIKRYL